VLSDGKDDGVTRPERDLIQAANRAKAAAEWN